MYLLWSRRVGSSVSLVLSKRPWRGMPRVEMARFDVRGCYSIGVEYYGSIFSASVWNRRGSTIVMGLKGA